MTEPLIKVPDVQFERARLMLDRARWAATRMQKLDRAAVRRRDHQPLPQQCRRARDEPQVVAVLAHRHHAIATLARDR